MRFLAIFIFFLTTSVWAAEGEIKAHRKGTISSINVGVFFSSILENRGIQLYNYYQVIPNISVFFLDDKVEFLGNALSYRDFVYQDRVRLRTRIQGIGDKPVMPINTSIKDGSPRRDSGWEWQNKIEIFLPGYNDDYFAEIDIGYYKEISRHYWDFFEIQGKVKMGEFVEPILKYRIEPNLYAAAGWGNDRHNQYFYGTGARQSGFSNLEYGVWFAFPDDADRYYPVILLKHYQVLGEDNRSASFANGRNEGWMFSFIASYGLIKRK